MNSRETKLVILLVMLPIEERNDAMLRLYGSTVGDGNVIDLEVYGYDRRGGMIQASSLISSIVAGVDAW